MYSFAQNTFVQTLKLLTIYSSIEFVLILTWDNFLFLLHCDSLGSWWDWLLVSQTFSYFLCLRNIWNFILMKLPHWNLTCSLILCTVVQCCLNVLCFYTLFQFSWFLGLTDSHWTAVPERTEGFLATLFLAFPLIRLMFDFAVFDVVGHFAGC